MEPPIVTASSTVAAGSDLQEDGTLRDETMKSALEVSDKEKNKESRYEILRLDKIWDK
ncbi:hypothetical protein NW752_009420 [Fusarium irregulare]|nr:hypothetical protein NW752_009420 [Fusarium irregulare]